MLLILLLAGQLSEVKAGNRDTIRWSISPLRFEDFRMSVVSQEFSNTLKLKENTVLEGYIFSGIHFSYTLKGEELVYEVIAYMIPAESWIRDGEDEGTLEHEQAHFDITEIYARRLRRDLAHVTSPAAAKKLMQSNFKSVQAEQRRFDKSHHDENGVHPLWQEKINKELKDLEAWAAPQVVANLTASKK